MSASRKTRSDSILGSLTEDRQAEIAEYARTHSVKETRAWLKADGVKVSDGAFSNWLSSWSLKQRFARAESRADTFRDWMARTSPSMSEEELDRKAGLMFQFEAVETGDPETFLAFATARQRAKKDAATIRLKEEQGKRDDRRIALLEQQAAKAEQAKGILQDEALSEEQKKLRMYELFGLR